MSKKITSDRERAFEVATKALMRERGVQERFAQRDAWVVIQALVAEGLLE